MFVYTYRSQYLNRVPLLFATVVSKKSYSCTCAILSHVNLHHKKTKHLNSDKHSFSSWPKYNLVISHFFCMTCGKMNSWCMVLIFNLRFQIEFYGSSKEKFESSKAVQKSIINSTLPKKNAHATKLHDPISVLKWLEAAFRWCLYLRSNWSGGVSLDRTVTNTDGQMGGRPGRPAKL